MKKELILKIISILILIGGLSLLTFFFIDIFVNFKTVGEGFKKDWPLLMMAVGIMVLSPTPLIFKKDSK